MSLGDTRIKTIVVHYAWEEISPLVERPTGEPITTPEIPADAEVPPGTPAVIEDVTGAGTLGTVGGRAPTRLRSWGRSGPCSTCSPCPAARPSPRRSSAAVTRRSRDRISAGPPAAHVPRRHRPERLRRIPQHLAHPRRGDRMARGRRLPRATRDARVFATREDDEQRTHVRFGDGENGAGLPAGVDNVVADYRVGSGAEVPPIGDADHRPATAAGPRVDTQPDRARRRSRSRPSGARSPVRATLCAHVRPSSIRRRLRNRCRPDPGRRSRPRRLGLATPPHNARW